MASKYNNMSKDQKAQYSKGNTSAIALKALLELSVLDETKCQDTLDKMNPGGIYFYLTGKEIGKLYLLSLNEIMANHPEVDLVAFQLSHIWQSIKMPVRQLMQLKKTNPGMVTRLKTALDE